MADSPNIDNPTNGDYGVSADEVTGSSPARYVQRTKLAYSADGSETHVQADADGLLVNLGANNDVMYKTKSTSGSFTASAQTVDMDVTDMTAVVVQVGGTYGTVAITFEALADNGSTWVAISGVRSDSAVVESASGNLTNTNRAWEFDVAGYTDFRVRCTARSSGTMTVAVSATAAAATSFVVAILTAGSSGIGSASISAVTPGVAATSLGKAEDAAHTSGDVGVMALAVRRDTPVTEGAAADYTPLHVDALGSLRVISRADMMELTATSGGLTTATTAYTAGDTVGNIFTFADAASVSGGYGEIVAATIIDSAKVLSICDLFLFNATPSPAADNAANSWSDANMNLSQGVVMFPGMIESANNRVLHVPNAGVPYKVAATSLFASLVTRTGHTFFGATTDLLIKLLVRRY